MAPNERKTEKLVRTHFDADKFSSLNIDEQRSDDPRIQKALKAASKQGGTGGGFPEFLIHAPSVPGLVIVVECKADNKRHRSTGLDQPRDFAFDGALHYARHLSVDFDVVAIGVSGQSKAEIRVSTALWIKGQSSHTPLLDRGKPVENLLRFDDYRRLRAFDPAVHERAKSDLVDFSRELHDYLYKYIGVAENEKPLVVSGTLLSLADATFAATYKATSPDDLPDILLGAIKRQLQAAKMPNSKLEAVLQPYTFIAVHEALKRVPPAETESRLQTLVRSIDESVRPHMNDYGSFDVIGQFYGEFLKYHGGDKKALGIVLTPRHVTELFCEIANVRPSDTVLDPCCGTGGFLISAMARMDNSATPVERELIRAERLVGVEQNPHMFALAASNMILRGDGKANLYLGSCFDTDIEAAISGSASPGPGGKPRHARPTRGLINPPFAQKGDSRTELGFAKHMLDCLAPDGIGVVILPISCAIMPSDEKRQLLQSHTLLASMSMPIELFYPVGTVTCILVFKAHQPHAQADSKTWFGYWRDDSFVKTKHRGRIDRDGTWDAVRARWLKDYRAQIEAPGRSVLQSVGPADEWCVEAYLSTDYGSLSREAFEKAVLSYTLFSLERDRLTGSSDDDA